MAHHLPLWKLGLAWDWGKGDYLPRESVLSSGNRKTIRVPPPTNLPPSYSIFHTGAARVPVLSTRNSHDMADAVDFRGTGLTDGDGRGLNLDGHLDAAHAIKGEQFPFGIGTNWGYHSASFLEMRSNS